MCKKVQFIILLLGVLCSATFANAYDQLRVGDPRNSWSTYQGTIEEAVISVKPRGIYMEYGLYLTFSARGANFSNSDTLEVSFYFDLPKQAIVHDSWLWIGDDIIRGKIMDKWTASSIYENIVRRRKDPSILYKRGQTSYELCVFPMAGKETRKVKITYLAPTQWTANDVYTALPTNLLRTSRNPISTFYLLTWLDDEWKNPKIVEFPEISFQQVNNNDYGDYLQANIPAEAVQSTLNFSLGSPLRNGVYFSRYKQSNDEGFYQMALLPSHALNHQTSRKVLVLFDYDASKTNLTKSAIINNVKSQLLETLTSDDSFNLMFSQLNIQQASDQWLSADSETISSTFASLGSDPMADYSKLSDLLVSGIKFIT